MSPRPSPLEPSGPGFAAHAAAMAGQPLHEALPAEPGAEAAALGFALGLAAGWGGPLLWAGEDGLFAEAGGPYPPGLAGFGIALERLIVVRARTREEALWAAEQGLALAGATVICALGAGGRALELKATRRLLLFAERNRSRCLIVRPRAEASAAWTRWRIAPAASRAEARELGAPAWRAELARSRAGPAGAVFTLEWNADARCFTERGAMDRDFSAAPCDRPLDPIRARA